MEITDWVIIFTSIFLGACALLVPYLAELVKRHAFAPCLNISYRHEPPFSHKTRYSTNEPVYYFRFQVVNDGKTQARLCEVVLENLWIYDAANSPQRYLNYSPVNLKWSGESNIFVNINPSRKIFCDIGHISSTNAQRNEQQNCIDISGYTGDDLRFFLELHQIFNVQPSCLKPSKYILQIGLYSENGGYQKIFLEISWSGQWRDSEIDMFREIVITRTEEPKVRKV